MKRLLDHYRDKKEEIKNRLEDFKEIYKRGDAEIFQELCFCILTPQANAVECDKSIKNLKKLDLLSRGTAKDIRPHIKSARFLNNKAKYIIEARGLFKNNGSFRIKTYIDGKDIFRTRDRLVKNVKGMGYKEASHFLRNIGFGKDLAILDVHILKNLKRYKVIKEIPKTITKKKYIEIENKVRKFSEKINIPMDELDLLFWSKETGKIFK